MCLANSTCNILKFNMSEDLSDVRSDASSLLSDCGPSSPEIPIQNGSDSPNSSTRRSICRQLSFHTPQSFPKSTGTGTRSGPPGRSTSRSGMLTERTNSEPRLHRSTKEGESSVDPIESHLGDILLW